MTVTDQLRTTEPIKMFTVSKTATQQSMHPTPGNPCTEQPGQGATRRVPRTPRAGSPLLAKWENLF